MRSGSDPNLATEACDAKRCTSHLSSVQLVHGERRVSYTVEAGSCGATAQETEQ